MKNKFLKQFLATTVLASTLLITNAGISQAALQANPNTQYKKTYVPTDWMSGFRKMEEAGGAMGLNETLKSDLTASSESNNIDIHMVKTTEYGAVAILSASGYGNPSNENAITTTTGNSTGVILNTAKWECTAGELSGSTFSGTNSRYFDTYEAATGAIPYPGRVGDALGNAASTNPGCQGWHKASDSLWVGSSSHYFLRGNGGIFSFDRTRAGNGHYCRGVVVVGSGL